MNAGRFLPVSCESVRSERPRAGNLKIVSVRSSLGGLERSGTNLLHGRTHRGQHLQCLPHHVELSGGLGRVVLVVDLLGVGGQVAAAVAAVRVGGVRVVVAGRL